MTTTTPLPLPPTGTPQGTSPFTSIFLTLTRPMPTSYTPYTILFQHSNNFIQRVMASELPENSTFSKDNRGGGLFIREAWKECVSRCDGRVVVVNCLDHHLAYTRKDHPQGDNRSKNDDDEHLKYIYQKNGAMVDLYSDPFGWMKEHEHTFGELMDTNNSQMDKVKQFTGHVSSLKSILTTIQQAILHIHESDEKKKESNQTEPSNLQKPIPIIFDTLTPIIIQHGIDKFTILLSLLKERKEVESTNTDSKYTPIPSPIFLPYLMETINPLSNRILEDHSDAVMTLEGGKLSIAKRSATIGGMSSGGLKGGVRLVKDIQNFEITKKGKLKLLLKNSVVKQSSESRVEQTQENNNTGQSSLVDGESNYERYVKRESNFKKPGQSHERMKPHLQHQSDEDSRLIQSDKIENKSKPKPVFYLEDDDPEFDDYDEEDPDDDLEI